MRREFAGLTLTPKKHLEINMETFSIVTKLRAMFSKQGQR